METWGPGARRPLVVFVYSRLANKGSLAGVNAAKRLRVREAAFGSKSGLSGIPHSNEAIRKAKRGRAFVRMKNDHPFKDLMRPDEDIGPYDPNAGMLNCYFPAFREFVLAKNSLKQERGDPRVWGNGFLNFIGIICFF